MVSSIFLGIPGPVLLSQATGQLCEPQLDFPLRPLQTADQSDTHAPPVTRLAEVNAHVATRWSLLEEEQLVSGVGDSGDRGHPQTAREEKILTKTIPGPTGGRPGIRGPSSSTWPASREQLPISAGLGEQWLAGGSSVTGALPARKSAFVPWGRGWGQARPRKGQEEESSPIHRPDRRNRQVPGGSQCPPGEGRTPEGPARRGAGDQTLTSLPARTLTLEPQERPFTFYTARTELGSCG